MVGNLSFFNRSNRSMGFQTGGSEGGMPREGGEEETGRRYTEGDRAVCHPGQPGLEAVEQIPNG
eukprot:scaffold2697_cov346-Pavlova_lutheri.AAC.27